MSAVVYSKLCVKLYGCVAEHANVLEHLQGESGNRATSNAVLPLMQKSSIWFTGRTDIIARLKMHFLSDFSHRGFRERKYFLLHGMGGFGKTQICLQFIKEMTDW